MTALEVLAPGVLALVEDLGRPGYAHMGVGRSGAADPGALRLANRLVANPASHAGIEVLLGGLRLRALGPVTVALAGARGTALVDGRPVGRDAVLEVPDGGELVLGTATRGLRTYLAVRGGIDVPPVLGSRSTDRLAGVGPAPLAAGDVLPVGAPPTDLPAIDLAPVPTWPDEVVVPVRPGPHADWFVDGLATLTSRAGYRATPASDRVAVRLDGPVVARTPRAAGAELKPVGLVPGAVQIPPDGRPVVFGADHPVTGGYPVLAVVRSSALGAMAQLRPGEAVRFVLAG
ncbi:5-oxoprolinase subunit C family protein [Cellulomonas edaphi]|uniref:Biotin-dependent carboxyltransferase family protein n=1 Tax=Cellulomonas edaphi TaxID=3053468 RepID=A0ABT7S9H2_9CELL|nr:biotin-dependent carboxyltransferase family protein [Cellulomons edaphi]MDM7832277.1 biotin-dependent carboxyltransferase family protein [Cellulomons edaphi]